MAACEQRELQSAVVACLDTADRVPGELHDAAFCMVSSTVLAHERARWNAPTPLARIVAASRVAFSIESPTMNELRPAPEDHLYERVAAILDEARSRVARTVNTAMTHAYWFIGREVVEVSQQGAKRAAYGDDLLKKLATKLTGRFGKASTSPTSNGCGSSAGRSPRARRC